MQIQAMPCGCAINMFKHFGCHKTGLSPTNGMAARGFGRLSLTMDQLHLRNEVGCDGNERKVAAFSKLKNSNFLILITDFDA